MDAAGVEETRLRARELRIRHDQVAEVTRAALAEARRIVDEVSAGPWRQLPPRAELAKELSGLRTAMASRAVIEQAKGVIMGTVHCGPDEAFELLKQQSQHQNRKLREVAQAIVDDVSRPRT